MHNFPPNPILVHPGGYTACIILHSLSVHMSYNAVWVIRRVKALQEISEHLRLRPLPVCILGVFFSIVHSEIGIYVYTCFNER